MSKFIFSLFFVFFLSGSIFAYSESSSDSVEVYLIEAFIAPKSTKLKLTFFTSEAVKSEAVFRNKVVPVSAEYSENHQTEIDITGIEKNGDMISFFVRVENEEGTKNLSELFEVLAEGNTTIEGGADLTGCIIGGMVYLIPSPGYDFFKDTSGVSFGKEFPLVSFFSGGYNYPNGYISFDYRYSASAESKSRYMLGYKQIVELPYIEFLSFGFSYATDFKGKNSVVPEMSLGLFRVMNVFTIYTRAAYFLYPVNRNNDLTQVSLGLFSAFFSLQR